MRNRKPPTQLAFALLAALSLTASVGPILAQGGHRGHGDHGDKPWYGRDRGDALRMDSTQDGDGSIKLSGAKDRDLDSAHVTLAPGGQATVVLLNNGGRDVNTLTGTWQSPDDGGNVPLGLTGQFGREAVRVGGSVNLRERSPGKFDRINLSGRVGRHGATIRFTAK